MSAHIDALRLLSGTGARRATPKSENTFATCRLNGFGLGPGPGE